MLSGGFGDHRLALLGPILRAIIDVERGKFIQRACNIKSLDIV